MDRLPKDPPFAIGTKLRYKGEFSRRSGYGCNPCRQAGKRVFVECRPENDTVTVAEHRPGHQGTLRQILDDQGETQYYDDTGEVIRDTTRDGYCLFHIVCPECGAKQFGPIIDDESKDEWEEELT
jgi:hypothetical protein